MTAQINPIPQPDPERWADTESPHYAWELVFTLVLATVLFAVVIAATSIAFAVGHQTRCVHTSAPPPAKPISKSFLTT